MIDLAALDDFNDRSIRKDAYACFEAVRDKGPIDRIANGIVVMTGLDEVLEVIRNAALHRYDDRRTHSDGEGHDAAQDPQDRAGRFHERRPRGARHRSRRIAGGLSEAGQG